MCVLEKGGKGRGRGGGGGEGENRGGRHSNCYTPSFWYEADKRKVKERVFVFSFYVSVCVPSKYVFISS